VIVSISCFADIRFPNERANGAQTMEACGALRGGAPGALRGAPRMPRCRRTARGGVERGAGEAGAISLPLRGLVRSSNCGGRLKGTTVRAPLLAVSGVVKLDILRFERVRQAPGFTLLVREDRSTAA
jgi:hypothetical protein